MPPQAERRLFVRFYALGIALAIGLGTAMLAGGPERFATPSFESAVRLVAWMPGPPNVPWACVFLIYGTALVFVLGKPIAVHVLRFGIAVYLFFVTTFIWSLFINTKASLAGLVIYSAFATGHLFLSDHLSQKGWPSK